MKALEDILYGSLAGIAGKYVEYPLDTIKVRLQSQPEGRSLRYAGPLDCFRQSLRADGVLGLYRGISAPLMGAAVETSSLFFFERMGRSLLYLAGAPRDVPLSLPALWFTGAFSGCFTSFFLTPVELVKCKIQVPAASRLGLGLGSTSSVILPTPALSPLAVIRQVYRHHGLLGFWHGQLGTFIRETGGCAAWFGVKETASKLFRDWNAQKSLAASDDDRQAAMDRPLPLWQQALAGAMAGVSYNFLFFPADTIKSRMQTTPLGLTSARPTFGGEAVALWRDHGLPGLYRGCGITCLRTGVSSAFIFIIFDALKRAFPLH